MSSQPYTTIPIRSAKFWGVIGATLFIMLGFGLIIPAIPQFVKRFHGGTASVAAVWSAFALTRLIGNFFTSGLLDRFGDRAVAAAGAGIVGVSSIAAGFSRNYAELLLLRGIGGFGSAFFLGALTAYLIATVKPEERGRAMSIFQASVGIGLLLGPLFGGLIIQWAPVTVPFFAYGLACFVFAPIAVRTMSEEGNLGASLAQGGDLLEEQPPAPTRLSLQRLRPLLSNSSYRAALAVSAVTFVIVSAPQTLLPQYWTDVLHGAKSTSGLPFTIEALAGIAIIWHAGALSDRRGRKYVLVPALAACIAGSIAMGYARSPLMVLVWMGVLGAASGYTRPGPTAIVADVAPPELVTVAVAGYRMAGDVGSLVGPAIAGALAKYTGFKGAWFGVAACMVLAFVMTAVSEETLPRGADVVRAPGAGA